jgi:hypothetical protein
MIDPQLTMNKSMSTALTMFLTNAKGGVMYETNAFTDPEMAKNQWAQPDAWIEMAEGGAEKIVQRQPVSYQGTIELFFTESKSALNYVSGIPADMMGVAVGEARTVLEFIREYWTQGQLIKVGGSVNGQAIPLLKSNLPLSYDLQLDDSVRHNPNLKAQVWNDIQPIIPSLLKFNLGSILLKILKFSPLPAQLVNEIQQQAQAMMQDPNQQQKGGRGKQEDPGLTQAKIAQTNAQAQLLIKQAQDIDTQARLKEQAQAMDAAHKQESLQQKSELNDHRHFADLMKGVDMLMGHTSNKTEVA